MSILKTLRELDILTLEFYFMYMMTSLALLEWLLKFSMHMVIILKVTFPNVDSCLLPVHISLENKPVLILDDDDKTVF